MYPVTQDFLNKMRADRRQVFARVEIDYTDPFMDQSLTIEASEQANVSYPQQTADSVDQTTRKYACLDGTWDLTTGEYHLAPSEDQLTQQQFGWWGAQFCDQDGYFASPYPTLTVRHIPRPIRQLKVVGDTAREEYPVDFTIKLYAQDDTLLKTETVIGNDQVSWSKALEPQVLDVARQELTISKWSLPGTCAKIIEFFTSIREVYETGDLVSVRLLEEREASQGSLPVGNISSNEITLALNNEDKKFDLDNDQSPLHNLLKPNRRIQAWLGAEAENITAENPPTFTRNSIAYLSDGTQVAANKPRFEQGKFGQAVLVEEETTNIVKTNAGADPLFNSSTGWTFFGLGASIANGVLTLQSPDGTTVSGCRCALTNLAQNTKHSFLIRARYKDTTGTANALILDLYASGYDNDEQQLLITTSQLTTAFQNFKKDGFDSQLAPSSVYLRIFTFSTRPIEVEFVQLEQKAYATTVIDGTRAAETLTIPTAGVLNPQEGTVECWVYVNSLIRNNNVNRYIFAVSDGNSSGSPNTLCLRHSTTGYWTFGTVNASGQASVVNIADNLTEGWHLFGCRWSSSKIALAIDGVIKGTVSNPYLPAAFAASLQIGNYPNTAPGSFCINTLIDDLRISNRARTDEEILAAYQSGLPAVVDEWTTYKLNFDGNLDAIDGIKTVWVPLGTFWSLDWDSPDDSLEATVTARDRMELLRKGTYQTSQVQQNKSLYELAELVLQDAGLTSDEYIIDTDLQNIIIPYSWFNPMSHREALRRIAEAGLAAAFQNRDGKIQIESFLISGDEPVLEITEDDYFPPLRAPSRQDQVANEVIVDTQPLRPAAVVEEVYRSNEPIMILESTTKTITAFYNKSPVIEAAASLDNPPAGVSITDVSYYGWGASVKIRNTNATEQQATLVIQGKPLTVQNKERAIARDETSILENGVLRFEFPANPLVQTLAQAQAIADALLASVKEPRRDIEVDWRGNPALLLGDRVTVKGKDYHVIRQEIDWAGALSARLTGRKA